MVDVQQLVEIRKRAGLSQAEFAAKIGYSREVVSKIENRKMPPSKWFLKAVEKFRNQHFSSVSGSDVIILNKISHGSGNVPSYQEQRRKQKSISENILVPLVGIKAQAGYLKGYEQTDFLETLDQYSLPPGVNPKGLEWSYFEVDGDSMEPNISSGDIILTSLLPQEDWNDVKAGIVYVILTDEQLLVKRVNRRGPKEWMLLSDNPSYSPISLDLSKLKQVWTLRRHIRTKVPASS